MFYEIKQPGEWPVLAKNRGVKDQRFLNQTCPLHDLSNRVFLVGLNISRSISTLVEALHQIDKNTQGKV